MGEDAFMFMGRWVGGGGGSVREYEGVHKGGRCMLVLHVWVHFVHLD